MQVGLHAALSYLFCWGGGELFPLAVFHSCLFCVANTAGHCTTSYDKAVQHQQSAADPSQAQARTGGWLTVCTHRHRPPLSLALPACLACPPACLLIPGVCVAGADLSGCGTGRVAQLCSLPQHRQPARGAGQYRHDPPRPAGLGMTSTPPRPQYRFWSCLNGRSCW